VRANAHGKISEREKGDWGDHFKSDSGKVVLQRGEYSKKKREKYLRRKEEIAFQ